MKLIYFKNDVHFLFVRLLRLNRFLPDNVTENIDVQQSGINPPDGNILYSYSHSKTLWHMQKDCLS